MRRRQVSLGTLVWIVVGMIVAAGHRFLDHLNTLDNVISAILAVALWPLVVLHVHAHI